MMARRRRHLLTSPAWLLALALLVPSCVRDTPTLELTAAQRKRVEAARLDRAPTPAHPIGAVFGGAVELIGVDLQPTTLAPGEPFTLTWYWRSVRELEQDYTVFVHLDSQTGQKRMNLDHHPVQGLHPIVNWKKGELLRDVQTDRIDEDFPEGPATLWVGIYFQDTRLPASPASVQTDGAARVRALQVEVRRGARTAATSGPAAAEVPVLEVRPAGGPLTIDGRLDEPAWQAAAWTGDFVLPGGEKTAPEQATQAAVLWTEQELVIAFRCTDDDVWTQITKDDGDLWEEEAVEVFLDPDGDGKTYVELQVNPANALFDAYFPTYRSDLAVARTFSSRARHAVFVDGTTGNRQDRDRSWTVELAVPYDALPKVPHVPPRPQDEWRMNLFRMDRPADGRQRAAAWSPPRVRDFHALRRFGRLRFVSAALPSPAAAPR